MMVYAKLDPSHTASKLRDCIGLGDFNSKTGKQNSKWGLNSKEKLLSQRAIPPKVSAKGGKSRDSEQSPVVHLGACHSN